MTQAHVKAKHILRVSHRKTLREFPLAHQIPFGSLQFGLLKHSSAAAFSCGFASALPRVPAYQGRSSEPPSNLCLERETARQRSTGDGNVRASHLPPRTGKANSRIIVQHPEVRRETRVYIYICLSLSLSLSLFGLKDTSLPGWSTLLLLYSPLRQPILNLDAGIQLSWELIMHQVLSK